MSVQLLHGDCLEQFLNIPDKSVDLVLTDPPYGTTACKWDRVIPFEPMWRQVWRVLKPNGAAVFTASQPFTSALVMSQIEAFRHSWVWDKKAASNVMNARVSPLKVHEDVLVFGKQGVTYLPQMVKGKMRAKGGHPERDNIFGKQEAQQAVMSDEYFPKSILEMSNASRTGKVHPTQKPVALMEYLIKTYTNEGGTVLDFTMGSGTTGVAAKNLGRRFIGIERDDKYFKIAQERILGVQQQEEEWI